jgi:two-component system response regulator FixJ
MSSEPTVFVVDDDHAMRHSLRWLLQSVGLAVETYATAEDFLAAYSAERPGCLVLDIRMPGMGGLQLQEELKARAIRLPIIVITGYAEVSTAVRALKAGAVDFLEKPFSDQQLVDYVRKAIDTDRVMREGEAQHKMARGRLDLLTTRERDVLHRVVDGKANKVIAAELGIVEKTVEAHRSRLMSKLDVDSLAGLIRLVQLARGD